MAIDPAGQGAGDGGERCLARAQQALKTGARLGYKPTGAIAVVINHLNTTWLWDKIRVQGGAYGGQCMFDRYSGGFTFVSYRDPNLIATLDTYDRAADFLRNADLNEVELTRNIVGTIGEVDSYRLPDAKAFDSMQRYLIGDTDEARQRLREEILSTTAADIRNFADAMAEVASAPSRRLKPPMQSGRAC